MKENIRLHQGFVRSRRRLPLCGIAALWIALPALLSSAQAVAGENAKGGTLRPVSASSSEQREEKGTSIPSTLIELDGTISSSPDGGELVYKWRQVSGPKVELSDYSAAKPYFRTSQPGEYEFELVVSANGLDSEPYLVNLIIEQENLPPVAKIPLEASGMVGKLFELDAGESYDPEGAELTYRWRSLTPGVELPPAALSRPVLSFEPTSDGIFEFELIVSDGERYSVPEVVRVAIKPKPLPPVARVQINTLEVPAAPTQEFAAMTPPASPKPIARIDGPIAANVGDMIMLDAKASFSPLEKPLEYFWRQKSGPFINDFELVFDGRAERFKPPREGDYEFELVVSDGDVDSEPAVHKVRVLKEMDPPVAVVVAPTRAAPGDLVKLDATQSYDLTGSPLVYRWRQTGGPKVKNYVIDEKLGDAAPAFHPPEPGIYSFELVVSNGKQHSKPVEIDIEVGAVRRTPELAILGPEVANAGDRLVLEAGAPGFEDRSFVFVWRQTGGPAMAVVETGGARVSLAPPIAGRYVFDVAAMENGQVVATAKRMLEVFNSGVQAPRPLQEDWPPPQQAMPLLPPAPAQTGSGSGGEARRRIPELDPLPDVTAPAGKKVELPPALPSSAGKSRSRKAGRRAAAQVMQNNNRTSP